MMKQRTLEIANYGGRWCPFYLVKNGGNQGTRWAINKILKEKEKVNDEKV